jgi:dihydrofolate reductase
MKCSVFIATSADGYIATLDDGIDWLETSGKRDVDLGEEADMGFNSFIASVDCMIMGRGCLEKLASFNLTAEQWPYGNIRVIALSRSLKQIPMGLSTKVELYSGDIAGLLAELDGAGFHHAYVDGGATITSFLNEKRIDAMIITHVPILLGSGKPLFGELIQAIKLTNARAKVFANDFIQISYELDYPSVASMGCKLR